MINADTTYHLQCFIGSEILGHLSNSSWTPWAILHQLSNLCDSVSTEQMVMLTERWLSKSDSKAFSFVTCQLSCLLTLRTGDRNIHPRNWKGCRELKGKWSWFSQPLHLPTTESPYNRLAEITKEILLNVTYTSKPSCGGSKVVKDNQPEGKE